MQNRYLHFTTLRRKTAHQICDKSQYMPLRGCKLSRGGKGKHPTRLIALQKVPVVEGVSARKVDFTLSASSPSLLLLNFSGTLPQITQPRWPKEASSAHRVHSAPPEHLSPIHLALYFLALVDLLNFGLYNE